MLSSRHVRIWSGVWDDDILTPSIGVADHHAGSHRSGGQGLDKAKKEPDFNFPDFDHDGRLAGMLSAVRLRIV